MLMGPWCYRWWTYLLLIHFTHKVTIFCGCENEHNRWPKLYDKLVMFTWAYKLPFPDPMISVTTITVYILPLFLISYRGYCAFRPVSLQKHHYQCQNHIRWLLHCSMLKSKLKLSTSYFLNVKISFLHQLSMSVK